MFVLNSSGNSRVNEVIMAKLSEINLVYIYFIFNNIELSQLNIEENNISTET